jgi:hypothetical protein
MNANRALLFAVVLAAACAPPAQKGRGGRCHSLSDCKPGLACVEGRCSADVAELEGEVPEYPVEEDAGEGAGDAGAGG